MTRYLIDLTNAFVRYGVNNTAAQSSGNGNLHRWLFALIGGLVIALIVTAIIAGRNKTKGISTRAERYTSGEGLELTHKVDRFLNTTRTVRKLESAQPANAAAEQPKQPNQPKRPEQAKGGMPPKGKKQ